MPDDDGPDPMARPRCARLGPARRDRRRRTTCRRDRPAGAVGSAVGRRPAIPGRCGGRAATRRRTGPDDRGMLRASTPATDADTGAPPPHPAPGSDDDAARDIWTSPRIPTSRPGRARTGSTAGGGGSPSSGCPNRCATPGSTPAGAGCSCWSWSPRSPRWPPRSGCGGTVPNLVRSRPPSVAACRRSVRLSRAPPAESEPPPPATGSVPTTPPPNDRDPRVGDRSRRQSGSRAVAGGRPGGRRDRRGRRHPGRSEPDRDEPGRQARRRRLGRRHRHPGPPRGPRRPQREAWRGHPAGRRARRVLVNLNTADEAALDTLPGVGPVMAQNIIAWRDSNGKFSQHRATAGDQRHRPVPVRADLRPGHGGLRCSGRCRTTRTRFRPTSGWCRVPSPSGSARCSALSPGPRWPGGRRLSRARAARRCVRPAGRLDGVAARAGVPARRGDRHRPSAGRTRRRPGHPRRASSGPGRT